VSSAPRRIIADHLAQHPELGPDAPRNADWAVDALEMNGYAIVPAAGVVSVRKFLADLERLSIAPIASQARLLARALIPDESDGEE
jgi:hypothetical protein